jgi:Tfp pilus assembly protein FimT
MTAMAIPIMNSAFRGSNADAAAKLISQQLLYARSLAVGTHQPVLVQFESAARTIVVAPGTGSARGPFVLPGKMQLQPDSIDPENPDNLGGNVLGAGGAEQVYFLDNGSAVDSPATNNILSGTIFLQHENGDADTRRAITLMGGTGRIHIWRYDTDTGNWK